METAVAASEILVAIGRTARTAGIGLESIGVEPVERWLEVDDQLRVGGRDWLYAVGDVNGRALLTHMGKYQARIAARPHPRARRSRRRPTAPGSPRVTFTDPQVAAVGHTLAAAKEAGVDAARSTSRRRARRVQASTGATRRGTTRIVVDEDRQVIVGATFVGVETADFLHAATIAVVGEVPLDGSGTRSPPIPTRSEVWLKLLEAYGL